MYLQKRFKKRVIGLAVSLIIVGQVQATTISTASTDQQSLTPGEDLDITSTGSITVSDSTDAVAIVDEDGYSGTINNAGSITTITSNPESSNESYGIQINDFNGTIINSGSIEVDGFSGATQQSGGLVILELDGAITNSGNITVSAESSGSSVTASGILVSTNQNAAIDNSGEINITSISVGADNDTYGIYVGLDSLRPITNSGSININANAVESDTEAYAIKMNSLDDTSLTNSGSISITANSDYGTRAYAISLNEITVGRFINTGSILINASSEQTAEAAGVRVESMINGSQLDLGDITITSMGDDAEAYGLFIGEVLEDNSLDGRINVDGDITLTAIATDDNSSAYGIYAVDSIEDSITIDGTISVTASSVDDSSAVGVYLKNELNSNLFNYGTVMATADADSDAYSIRINGGEGSVQNDGTLIGGIAITGDMEFDNNGIITVTPTQNISIEGEYNQTDGGVVNLAITDESEYATMYVSTNALFDAGSILNIVTSAESNVGIGDTFDDIIEAGALDASNLSITDNSYLLAYDATIDRETLDLVIVQGNTISDALATRGTGYQQAGQYWDRAFLNGVEDEDLSVIIASLSTLSSAQEISAAIASTLPSGAQASGDTANNVSGTTGNVVTGRQQGTRGHRGISTGDEMQADRNFWFKPFYSKASQNSESGISGYTAETYGTALGFDTELRPDYRIGAALFYSQSDIDVNEVLQSSEVDSFNVIAYGSLPLIDDSTYLDWQAGVGIHDNSSRRYVSLSSDTATANYAGWSAQLSSTLTREYPINLKTTVRPLLKASYQYQENDSYEESGAGALNLNVAKSSNDRLIIGTGASLEHRLTSTLTLNANAGLNYDLLNTAGSITSSYAGDSTVSFSTAGIESDPLSIEGGLGLTYLPSENFNVEFAYDLETRSGFDNQSVSAKLKWTF